MTQTTGPDGATCGACKFRHGKMRYPKCELGPATRGPATDVRAYWPACHRFEEV